MKPLGSRVFLCFKLKRWDVLNETVGFKSIFMF